MSGLTKVLTKCDKKGLTMAISLIQERIMNYCNYWSNYSCLLVIYLNALTCRDFEIISQRYIVCVDITGDTFCACHCTAQSNGYLVINHA